MEDLPDSAISVVEGLDSEPESKSRKHEVALGLLLVLALLMWVGWEWWQQEYRQNQYHLAQQADLRHDLDTAHAHYSAIPGYKDADKRREELDKRIAERDRQYQAATSAAQKGDWAAAFQAAQEVTRIQKGYRDSARIQTDARNGVYRDALQGAVALRTGTERAGLYYRGPNSWIWLERSDRWSQVLPAYPSGGIVLYDIPGEGWSRQAFPIPTPGAYGYEHGRPDLAGRRIMVAVLSDDRPISTSSSLAFDPAIYHSYGIGENGVWAFRGIDEGYRGRSSSRVLTGYGGVIADYQAFGSSITSTVSLPPDFSIVSLTPDGNQLLVAEESSAQGFDEDASINLYLADAAGDNRRLVYSYTGFLHGAHFSQDSRYVLLTITKEHTSVARARHLLLLLDLPAGQTRVLRERVLGYDYSREAYPPWLEAAFLYTGPFAGRVLVTDRTKEAMATLIYDPARPDQPEMTIEGVAAAWAWTHELGGTGKTLLVWQEYGAYPALSNPVFALQIAPGEQPITASIPITISNRQQLTEVRIRGEWVVYGLWDFTAIEGIRRAVYTTPLQSLESAKSDEIKVTLAYRATFPRQGSPQGTEYANLYFGPKMLAYIEDRELHARTYDGTIDLVLEQGVTAIYNVDW